MKKGMGQRSSCVLTSQQWLFLLFWPWREGAFQVWGESRSLTCSFSSCSPKVEMPPVDVRSGVLGRRHTLLSRSQETLQVKAVYRRVSVTGLGA